MANYHAINTRFGVTSLKTIALATTLLVLSTPAMAAPEQLSFDGIVPVRLGMTVAQAEKALHAELSMQFPPDSDSTECAIAVIKGRDRPFSFMVEHGRITRADLGGRGVKSPIKTASGIGLGSSIAEIKRAYGSRGKWHPNAYDDEPVFEIKSVDNKSAILFVTERGRVIRIHAGRLPSAEYVEGCE
jgi:hypothetical protein